VTGASILHFDTHGFCVPLSATQSTAASENASTHVGFEPLIEGVALAGANHAQGSDGSSDGILWADEIATLNLNASDLVTLSACQTALGDLIPGAGMQGCQRALLVAGAASSLTSLWSVNDTVTQAMMAKFYERLWSKHEGKAESLRQSMVYMIHGFPQASDNTAFAKGHRCPPALWASWVLSGEGR
jgi:CHAT domain-containing protein